jgi:hypothetical protein
VLQQTLSCSLPSSSRVVGHGHDDCARSISLLASGTAQQEMERNNNMEECNTHLPTPQLYHLNHNAACVPTTGRYRLLACPRMGLRLTFAAGTRPTNTRGGCGYDCYDRGSAKPFSNHSRFSCSNAHCGHLAPFGWSFGRRAGRRQAPQVLCEATARPVEGPAALRHPHLSICVGRFVEKQHGGQAGEGASVLPSYSLVRGCP